MNRLARGFTLIEILIVTVLLAILLGIAAPSFVSFISNYRATAAINDVLQAVTMTRSEALKRGRRVTLAPLNADWRQGWIIFVDSPTGAFHNQTYDTSEVLIYQHQPLSSTIAVQGPGAATMPFRDASTSRSFVAFDGTGYPRDSLGSSLPSTGVGLMITDSAGASIRNVRTLCLSTLGRVRIVKQADPC